MRCGILKITDYTMKKEKSVFHEKETKELNSEELELLLDVNIRDGVGWEEIAKKIKLGTWIKFVVTKNHHIVLGSYSDSHRDIMEMSGLHKRDLDIDNGLVRESENADALLFSYQTSPMTPLHHAAERKIMTFLRDKGLEIPERYEHPFYQPH